MITEALLGVIFLFVTGVLHLLPAITLPSGMITALNGIFLLIGGIGFFVPLDILAYVLGLVLVVNNIKVGMDIFSWVVRKIPGGMG